MNHKNKLEEMPVRPLLYTMAVPLMLSLLVQSLYNIVDSMFVARLSEAALTAASLVYPVQFLMIAVGVGTAVGLNALLSRKIGERKTEEACQAATTGLILMLVTSMIFSAAGIFCSDQIADGLTPDPELQKLCRQYLSVNLVYCWGIFLQTYGQRLLQAVIPIVGYNDGAGKTKRVQETWKVLLPTGIVLALCGTVLFCVLPEQLLSLFSASPEMLLLGTPALRIISVSFALAAVTVLCGYFSSGLGNGVINMVGASIRQVALLVPCLVMLIRTAGIASGWYAFWIAEAAACLYSYGASKKLLKKKTEKAG